MKGSIQKKGKNYYAVIPLGGKRKWFKGGTRKDAERVLAERLHEIQGGTYQVIKKISFTDYVDQWLESRQSQLKPSTIFSYRHTIEGAFKPAFRHITMGDLTPAHMEQYRTQRLRSVSPKTLINEISLLKLMCRHAVKMGYCKNDPAIHLERPRYQRPDIEILEPPEIQRLLDHSANLYRSAFFTAVLTGVRAGELWALQWGDLDWETKKLFIRRSVWKGIFHTPKTKNAIRAIDVTDDLLHELRKWKLACPLSADDLMFPTRDGRVSHHENVLKHHFMPALRRAKLRHVSFHSLRHTNASLRIRANQNLKYLCSQLGHASVKMSLDVYGHLFKDEDFQRQQVSLLQTTFQSSVRNPLENALESTIKGQDERALQNQ